MSKRILAVDDDDQIRWVVRQKLEGGGFEVDEARDGDEAIEMLDARAYDLVVADIVIPERDGLEVIMHLKRRLPHVKVIAISAPANQLYLENASAFGADMILPKPFELAALERAVREMVSQGPPGGAD